MPLRICFILHNSRRIKNIISLIKESTFDVFYCKIIATKAVLKATERRKALSELTK